MLAVECSFAQVRTFLHRLLGVELPVASLEQMNQALSQEVEGFWQRLPPVPPATGEAVVVISADGKGVPMRKAADSAPQSLTPNHFGPQPGRKKMALVGSLYTVAPYIRTPLEVVEALFAHSQAPRPADAPARPQPQHKRVRAALSEAPARQSGHSAQIIFPWLRDELLARDPQHTQAHVVVMDGQQTLWDELETALQGQTRVEVLDLLHAAGYLWKAVHLFHNPGSPSAQALMKLCLLALLEGQVKTLLGWLSDQAEQVSLCAQAREQLVGIKAYFHHHRHRVQYDQYLAKGYPIASGVIEGACRHVVKDRLERTGMNWTLPGAQAMLALRCVAINDQWEAFMTHRIEQETERLYPYASQNRLVPQPFLQAA